MQESRRNGPERREHCRDGTVDAALHFTFDSVNTAFLLMEDLLLVARVHHHCLYEPDDFTLNLGAIVAALRYGAGVKAEWWASAPLPSFSAFWPNRVSPEASPSSSAVCKAKSAVSRR